jgi:hypothetical protein
MTREQVIEWANKAEAHADSLRQITGWTDAYEAELCRLAREDMREQCAKVCADFGGFKDGHSCAEAIRNLEV